MAGGEPGTLDELGNGLFPSPSLLFEWGILGIEPLASCTLGKCCTLSYIPSLANVFKGILKLFLEFRNLSGPG